MNETLTCAACGRSLHVPDDLLGQDVKCPACHHTFTAPDGGSAPPREAPAPRRVAEHAETAAYDPPAPGGGGGAFAATPWPYAQADKPGKAQAIAIMTMAGGVVALLVGAGLALSCIGLAWPGTYYSFVLGVMAVLKASALLGDGARGEQPPKAIAIMQIINVVNGDVVNLTLGIVTLVFLGDREVRAYFRR
jgi:hypothetical protein